MRLRPNASVESGRTSPDYEGHRLSSVTGLRFVRDARPAHGRQLIPTTNQSRCVSVHELVTSGRSWLCTLELAKL